VETDSLARMLILFGIVILVVGAALLLFSRIGFTGLPGDISFKRDGVGIYFPIATSIVASIILTIVLNVVIRLFR
jgi:hypothetical protein